jgi:hypothetical protein
MAEIIKRQNQGIVDAWQIYTGTDVTTNHDLARALNIELPPSEYQQNYTASDIKVKVI